MGDYNYSADDMVRLAHERADAAITYRRAQEEHYRLRLQTLARLTEQGLTGMARLLAADTDPELVAAFERAQAARDHDITAMLAFDGAGAWLRAREVETVVAAEARWQRLGRID